MSADESMAVEYARWPIPAALAYTAFPVYGSLIPFHWEPRAPSEAWDQFMAMLAGPVSVASRADVAANVLLATPFGWLWMAAIVALLGAAPRRTVLALAAAGVIAAGITLAASLEFAQHFFSARKPALSDIVAQGFGAAVGVLAWRLTPTTFWRSDASSLAARRNIAALYLVGLVLYALLPLDLTVSLSEVAAKWKAGRVFPVPFTAWYTTGAAAGMLDLVLDGAIWCLAALLIRRAWFAQRELQGPVLAAMVGLVGLSLMLEVAQLLVMSRVVDGTDVVAAGIGVLIGAAWGGREKSGLGIPSLLLRLLVLILSVAFTVLLQTWPLEAVTDAQGMRSRWQAWSAVPFATYASASELSLVTNVLRRLGLYGALAWVAVWALAVRRWSIGAQLATVTGGVAAVALGIEAVQLALPGRHADVGDVLLAAAASMAVILAWPGGAPPGQAARAAALPLATHPPSSARRHAVVLAGLVIAASMALPYLPSVPYNLRELLAPEGRPWPAVLVGVSALALAALGPWLAVAAVPLRRGSGVVTPAGLLGGSMLVSLLLIAGAPRESVHDLVGVPVLGIADSLETVGRLAVLLLGVVWASAVGHAFHGGAPRSVGAGRAGPIALLTAHGLWVLPLWHLVVVRWAGTDNLTELMDGGGGVQSTASLLAWVALLAATGAALEAAVRRPDVVSGVATLLELTLSVLLGWWLLNAGTEEVVVKYGRVFSTPQFLLSAGRDAYAEGPALWGRYLLAHFGATGLAAVGLVLARAAGLTSRHIRGNP